VEAYCVCLLHSLFFRSKWAVGECVYVGVWKFTEQNSVGVVQQLVSHLSGQVHSTRVTHLRCTSDTSLNGKKTAQRRRKHCMPTVVRRSPKIFSPPQTPLPGARDGQNLISWRWTIPLPTNPVWWGSMHAISSYRGNRPTNTHTHKHRQDRLQHTASLSLPHTHPPTHKQTLPITIHSAAAI